MSLNLKNIKILAALLDSKPFFGQVSCKRYISFFGNGPMPFVPESFIEHFKDDPEGLYYIEGAGNYDYQILFYKVGTL